MLLRLKVNGFKNLMNVDVRLGPFTCVAGANGVGKSNLFDAIRFLSLLANKTLTEAALSVRAEGGSAPDLRSLFHRVADRYDDRMSFEAEMIVPGKAIDDLGQTGEASITILRYLLELGYRQDIRNSTSLGSLEILKEELSHIKKGEAGKHLIFPHSRKKWRDVVVAGARRSPFISTEGKGEARVIKLHQDHRGTGRGGGRTLARSAANLPRTVVSVANAAESPTVLCARREMESWRILQLEPSALRKPDELNASPHLSFNGAHLPASLYHLAQTAVVYSGDKNPVIDPDFIYSKVANRLTTLIGDVRRVWVDRDDKRETLTLQITGIDGTDHPARSLSDGTLRFLALSVLELDVTAQGLICLEEPENGIHPERIPAMLELLQDIATDPDEPVDDTNPLRQVIVNTHSPAVVSEVPDDSLLVAEITEDIQEGKRFKRVSFSCLSDTWRTKALEKPSIISKGILMAYLNPASPPKPKDERRPPRVVDRDDLQMLLPLRDRANG
ncbi:MAG: AAA family ATPase [Thermodesulfobacteriota bacterium]